MKKLILTLFVLASAVFTAMADTDIIVMNDGKIDAVGTHEELIATNRIYQDGYNSQKKGSDEEVSENA